MSYASIDNDEFYPTPIELIDKMIKDIDFHEIRDILEPEAGKGDIVDRIIEKCTYNHRWCGTPKLNIDTIEIDTNLVHILKGKEYRVIHDDFLTFNTQKQYDLIIMNPPFSSGDKHLLKAIDMQQNGGGIVCILNAETIKNPYSNVRKDLVNKLTHLNASIEYLQRTFSNAEHSTNVEIALIKIFIPKKENTSFIFEKLKKSEIIDEFRQPEHQELIVDDYIKEIIDRYNIEIKAGIELINEYNAMKPFILKEIGSEYNNSSMLNLSINNSNQREITVNNYIQAIRMKYWEALFRNPKFMGKLTDNLQRQYYNKISELKDYDFSFYNIYTIKLDMQQHLIKGIEDTILELFEEFSNKYSWINETSKNIHYYNGWKTNKAWKINKKVIIPLNGFYERYEHRNYKRVKVYDIHFRYSVVNKLSEVEKVLNYLDGNITENISLERALDNAKQNYQTSEIDTKYFKLTFYKKGTCHLEFKNDDLLHKFNIYGSQKKNWLPPSYGKVKYKDMTKEEQNVIDEFEGKENYEKTLLNKHYFFVHKNSLLELPE